MKQYTDIQKIDFIQELNKLDKVSKFKKNKAKKFIIEMYNETIEKHNRATDKYIENEITCDEVCAIQTNCINYIKMLKMINSKHAFYKKIMD